jgi:hypothetical protein
MVREVADRRVIAPYVREVRRRLESGAHDDAAYQAASRLGLDAPTPHDAALIFASKLPPDGVGPETEPAGEVPFISRDPLVSLIQTSLETQLKRDGLAEETPPEHPHYGAFGQVWQAIEDFIQGGRVTARGAEMGVEVVEGMLGRFTEGTHDFNPEPAECAVDGPARLIVVGDWGSGLPQAGAVAQLMAGQVKKGLDQARHVHVIHLGDVYFAGEAEEYQGHVLAEGWWPVTWGQAADGVGSWSLAGNHDLYGGAHAYFTVLLGDPRFRRQRSADGSATSWFRLMLPSWDVIGLDTSWNDDPFSLGQTGDLQEPQAPRLAEWTAQADGDGHGGPRKRLVLTHHQLMTAYDNRLRRVLDQGRVPPLHAKLAPVVDSGAFTAWIWGHEHRCMAFERQALNFPRCLGHGGQLLAAHDTGTEPPAHVVWEETASFELAGRRWGSFGFAVLDVDGPEIKVSYVLEGATPVVPTETFA